MPGVVGSSVVIHQFHLVGFVWLALFVRVQSKYAGASCLRSFKLGRGCRMVLQRFVAV